jgi:hypothetical protein
MALTRLNTIAETKAKASSSDRPVCNLTGNLVARFNTFKQIADDAKAKAEEARLRVLNAALATLFTYNVEHPTATVKTIDVTDTTGSVARLTSQDKWSAANPDAVEALFESLGAKYPELKLDVNDFVQETVTASFDSSVFNVGDEGKFDQEVYDAYADAISKVTTSLIAKKKLASGTESPLKTTKKVLPLDSFNEKRWVLFTAAADHAAIRDVISNTITLSVVSTTTDKKPTLEEKDVNEVPPALSLPKTILASAGATSKSRRSTKASS